MFYIQDTSPQSLKRLSDYINILEKKFYDDNGQSLRDGSISTDDIKNLAITTDKVGLLAITTPLIANSAVIAEKIAQFAIDTVHISPLAVTTDKIGDEAITNEKIVALAITADKIAANAITTDKLSANSVTAEILAADSIYSKHIAADQILANHISAGAIESDAIATNAILAKHIQAEQIQANHIAVGAVTTNALASDVGGSLDISSNISITSRVTKEQYQADLLALQSQIDKSVSSWFYDYVPTLGNEPASLWTTNELKQGHLGDLFYDVTSGYSYRFIYTNGAYSWSVLSDSAVTEALNKASKAQDTADNKRRVFISTPIPPYDKGDLWSGGTTGDLKICILSKSEGAVYLASDWEKATKYTDDTTANQAKTSAENANNLLADFSADNKLTQAEKLNIKTELEIIISEKPLIDAKADTFLITTEKTNYGTAYTDLYNYINPIINASGTSDIVGDTLRLKFKNYYNAKLNLIQKMTDLSKDTADYAKDIADYAKTVADTLDKETLPLLESRVTTAEQKITDEEIVNTVIKSESYLSDTKVANYTPLPLARNGMALNPLQTYNFAGGDVFAPNKFAMLDTGVFKPIYTSEINIIDDDIVTFDYAVDKVKVIESDMNQQADKIGMVIYETENGNVINSAGIVMAINNGTSKIAMEAMDIDLTGLVSFNSLNPEMQQYINSATNAADVLSTWQVPNKTTINGAYIEAGTLKINQILMGGANGFISWGAIDKTLATAESIGAKPYDWLPQYSELLGTKPPSDADNTIGIIGANRLTYIDNNGIYTGTLTAEQINVIKGIHLGADASIDWSMVTPPTASQVGAKAADWMPDLTAYVTKTSLNTTLSSYVQASALNNYMTYGEVSAELMEYVSNSELTTMMGYNYLVTGKIAANSITSGTLDCMNLTVKNLNTASLYGSVINFTNGTIDSQTNGFRFQYDASNYIIVRNGNIGFYVDGTQRGELRSDGFYNIINGVGKKLAETGSTTVIPKFA